VFHPAFFAGINDLSLNQVAAADLVASLHDGMHSRADSRAADLRLVPAGQKMPRREGRGVQSGELKSDQ
jgi:hypothetical protein